MRLLIWPTWRSIQLPRTTLGRSSSRSTTTHSPACSLGKRRRGGQEAEEHICARESELLEEVDFWVRNLVHATQFWMPTATQRTYPDFVARLKDGRLFVIEYKGGDRVSNDDSKEKRLIGELWAKKSGG